MKINPTIGTNSAEVIKQTMTKVDVQKTGVANNPSLAQSPAQINRSFEISRDPPVTVLKYTNESTKQVELQIPSEVSLRMYKANLEFVKRMAENTNVVDIKV